MLNNNRYQVAMESPVSVALRAGSRGDGNWPGFDHAYRMISAGCESMGRNPYLRCSADHVDSMADLGSGHEERMKYRLGWMRMYGYVTEGGR